MGHRQGSACVRRAQFSSDWNHQFTPNAYNAEVLRLLPLCNEGRALRCGRGRPAALLVFISRNPCVQDKMKGTGFQFACLSDPRLAAHALSPTPVWLWSADATRILWANPTAAAIFDAESPGALAAIALDSKHPAVAEIARVSGTLPQTGAPRLERLRGFGASFGGPMICLCSRFLLRDNTNAVLVRASFAGLDLALSERARRLLADADRPAAIFSGIGELIDCTPAARERLGAARNLLALGAEKLMKEASIYGYAEGEIDAGHVVLYRLGAGTTVALLVAFDDAAIQPAEIAEAPAAEPVEEISSPPPAVPSTAPLPPSPAPASLVETAPTLSPGEQDAIQPAEIAEAPAAEPVEEISSPPPAVPSTAVEEISSPPTLSPG